MRPVPELPEVERARALVEARALGRVIAEVDDTDTWVCRPHSPGEIADALAGRTLTAALRRGKAMWVETDEGEGPELGIHLGMAGRIIVDDLAAGDRLVGDDGDRVGPVRRCASRTAACSRCATSGGSAASGCSRTSRGVGPDAALVSAVTRSAGGWVAGPRR